jgi:SAM-dependent methyltransferase
MHKEGIGYQYLENLSTAYWYSQALFAAVDLEVFTHIFRGAVTAAHLADCCRCRQSELVRLLGALEKLNLVKRSEDRWENTALALRYLIIGHKEYLGDFLLYRQYMQPQWLKLTEHVRGWAKEEKSLDYKERNQRYVVAMDELARRKAEEIVQALSDVEFSGPILDIGGGAGALLKELRDNRVERRGTFDGDLFELPEVVEAARELYPLEEDWEGINRISGDFRSHIFQRRYGMIILSNFLHIYSHDEAEELLSIVLSILQDGGLVLIHDYFPDRNGAVPEKGTMYDLCMMLNTHSGVCHDAGTICTWLQKGGLSQIAMRDLETDSSLIIAFRPSETNAAD